MVFESVVVDVLNRFLGDYVVNLDSSQLKLGIWGGAVALKNLEIKENALSQLDVPFKVKAGHIGKLDLKIPWKNLYTQPVEAVLDGVYLLIVPTASIKYDAEKEEKQLLETKQQELQRIEDAKQKVADQEKPKEERQDTFVEKLITQVIKNLQVKISNIHIRYEDDITNPKCPLSFGVSLQNLSLQTSDKNWNPCLHDESAKLFYKLVRLDNLFAYWNVNSNMFYHKSNTALETMKYGIAAHNTIPEGYDFVFRPISGRAKLRMNPRSDVDFSSPKIDLDVNLQDIAIDFNKPQYHSVMELLESIDLMSRNLPYRKFRPDVCVTNHASKWWKYAITGIMEVNIKPRLYMWSWKCIRKHRLQVKKYKELYRTKITSKKPPEEVLSKTEEYEKALDIFNITLARQQAEMEACKAGLKIYRPGAKDDECNSKGWFGWVWGWSGETTEKKEDFKSGGLEELMSPDEKTKLYAAIGYSDTAVDPTLPKTFEAMRLCVKLLSMSVQLREDKGTTELINFAITDLSTELKQRPGAQAIKFEAQIGTFEVTGTPQGKSVPCLLSSRHLIENNISLLSLMFETNPLDERADQRLQVESQPLEIIYDAKTINNLVDFFRPPQDVHLEQLASATMTKLEEFRDRTSTGLLYVIETQKVLDLKINLMASYIIVPENGFYEQASNLLLLDLGSLKMVSKSRSHLPQLKVGQSTIEDIMSRAYDSFDVQLSNMQLLYRKDNENWKQARNLKRSSQHILEPMDLKVEFSRAMVVTDARMPKCKLSGELPILSVQISDQKLKGVLELIDSIPKPESPPESSASPQRIAMQKSTAVTTPQLAPRRPAFVDLPSLIESESEEEFYDAPTSPVEEMPFFQEANGTLVRTDSLRKKKLRKQETLKNMTEFQMRFEIPNVTLQLYSLSKDVEKTILHLEILGLGTVTQIVIYIVFSF
ncbi:vacuolar protein sorting 13 homolog A L homeolog [Xenopus laevis]|uniref:LOC445856 protein n=1 Tax=Xenopus laevis TaxID=8355 RepID=Q63ZN2_XENLA|nr:vacuolar protein sorting 13 homolog A L homeolog [Xenopus laevis]AAH82879.1 LOC445856 protein [Xenopus laevis]